MPPDEHGPMPLRLSQTALFRDVRTLTPSEALIPYEVNVSFWSDGASKHRWIALPPGGRIRFSATGAWAFPAGTIFVKHFEVATDPTRPKVRCRIETRLLVRDRTGGVYGVTYQWRPDGSDADLLDGAWTDRIPIHSASGTRTLTWTFPGRSDCRTCHTPQAGYVLGVTTRQTNRAAADRSINQLVGWSRRGLFANPPDEKSISSLPKLSPASDVSAPIEQRARSFLDANCAQCHRPGGVSGYFDARFDTPLAKQSLVDGPVLINLGLDRARVIAPNDPWRSVALTRIATLDQPKMPPIAHNTIDANGVELLRSWIATLPGRPALAPPVIRPAGGDFQQPIRVELLHPDHAAQIRYTLDGSPPDDSSTLYTAPLELTGPTTLRARAYRPGATRSITSQETFIIGD